MFFDILTISIKSVLHNKLRSTLSILGIIIGVCTIVLVNSISGGVEKVVAEQLKFLSVTSIIVEVSDTVTSKSKLDASDTYHVLKESKNVVGATAIELGRGNISGNNKTETFNIIGTTETFNKVMNLDIEFGRYFSISEVSQSKKEVVIGNKIIEKIFRGNKNVIGKSIYVGSTKFNIIGVIKNAPVMPNMDLNATVFIPFTTSQKFVLGETSMKALVFLAKDIDTVSIAVEDIKKILREKHQIRDKEVDDFNIFEQKTIIQAISLILKSISFLLIGIAVIILIVSGIGIMNVMFAGVAERTKDIGISRAIGARKKDILIQFLIESIILTVIGGIIGVLLGEGIILLINNFSEFKMIRNNFGDLFAVSFAFFIGVFFGIYPAKKATKLDIVESLK